MIKMKFYCHAYMDQREEFTGAFGNRVKKGDDSSLLEVQKVTMEKIIVNRKCFEN